MHAAINKKKLRAAILISKKVNFRIRNITREKEAYFKMIKLSMYQET